MLKFGLVLLLLVGAVLLYPSPIDSAAYNPSQPMPMIGVLTPNDALQVTQLTSLPGSNRGGEDVAVDNLGCIYTGTENGSILRQCPHNGWETLANTGGRPLGLALDQQQNLIIADGEKGLMKLTPMGNLEVLLNSYQGVPLRLVDDVDVGADGTLYFSDASAQFSLADYLLDGLTAKPSGRLFSYNSVSGELRLLADQLFFANGVAVAADQSFVLVNETFAYQTTRIWLTGAKAGQRETWAQQLPGAPDGIAADTDGTFWMALYAPRNAFVDRIHSQPWIKNLVAKIPVNATVLAKPYGFIVQLDADGNILQSLHDQAAVAIGGITSVQPESDGLYLGTLHGKTIGKLLF